MRKPGRNAKRVFEKSRFCHISPTMFPHSSFQTAGANPGPRTVSLDLPGLFKHPLSGKVVVIDIPVSKYRAVGQFAPLIWSQLLHRTLDRRSFTPPFTRPLFL